MAHSLEKGGSERNILDLCTILSDEFQIHLVLNLKKGDWIKNLDNRVITHYLEPFSCFSLFSLKRIIHLFHQTKPHLIFSFFPYLHFLTGICCLFSKTIPHHWMIEGTTPEYYVPENAKNSLVSLFYRLFPKLLPRMHNHLARGLLVQSTSLLEKWSKIGSRCIHLLPNPIIPNKQEYFYSPDFPYLLHIGRLHPVKNQTLLLKAFSRIQNDIPHHLILCGDGPERKKLETLSKDLQINHKVHFTGEIPNSFYYLKNSSAFILSSLKEGLPNTILEAVSAHVPVLVSDCPSALKEYFSEEDILYFQSDCEEDLSKKILLLLSNSPTKETLHQLAIEKLQPFSAEKIKKIIRKLIEL